MMDKGATRSLVQFGVLWSMLFCGCGFEDPNMIPLDSNITAVSFCGQVRSVHGYKGSLQVLLSDSPRRRSLIAHARDVEPEYLQRTLQVGDTLCKTAGSSYVELRRKGESYVWTLYDPAYADVE